MTLSGLAKFLAVMVCASVVSVYASQIVWPRLAGTKTYDCQCQSDEKSGQGQQVGQIIIEEKTALKDAIAEVGKSIVSIKSLTSGGKSIVGQGLVLSSDGLIVALSDFLPPGGNFQITANGQALVFEVAKRDANLGLALVKAEAKDLPTRSFLQDGDLKLGERVFLLSDVFGHEKFANEGIVKSAGESVLTTIVETALANGSPVFNIKGEIAGLSLVSKTGQVAVLPISKIKEFSGL